jgi:Protein of unknown function (DUF2738)
MSVLPAQFDASLVTFGEIKALQSGAKAANLNYDGRSLVMQVSNLDVPYGLNTEDKYGPTKYSVNLSLRDFESNPKTKAVFDALQALDDSVTKECVEKNWLRKPGMTQQILKQMKLYKPTVKFSEDENGNRKPYPPTVKVALRKKNDKFETVFYDTDKKEIKDVPIEDLIVKRMTVTALIECTGVWISSVGCGLSWKVKQMKIVSRPDGVGRGYGFVDEDEGTSSRPAARAAPSAVASKNNFADAFDDDEDEVDDEAVTAPAVQAPAPVEEAVAPKPKTIVKKKIVAKA